MPKHTITLGNEEVRLIKVIKSVHDCSNIDDAIKFIITDYAKIKNYDTFIKNKRKEADTR